MVDFQSENFKNVCPPSSYHFSKAEVKLCEIFVCCCYLDAVILHSPNHPGSFSADSLTANSVAPLLSVSPPGADMRESAEVSAPTSSSVPVSLLDIYSVYHENM